MDTMERDPVYIAEMLRFLRQLHSLTQENVADAAGLTTRTIEHAESGRRRPNEQTLRAIARALSIDVSIFEKPTPQEEARWQAEMERMERKTVMVPTTPIHTANDFKNAYGEWHGWRVDTATVECEEALSIAAQLADYLQDLDGIWGLCSMTERLEYSRHFAELCGQLGELGYVCHIGQHRQRLRESGKPDLVFLAGLMSIRPKAGSEKLKYAILDLDGAWETLPQDRPGAAG